ncbi:MAG: hypothetical protein ACXWT1_19575 [Methylobacter sp.]
MKYKSKLFAGLSIFADLTAFLFSPGPIPSTDLNNLPLLALSLSIIISGI